LDIKIANRSFENLSQFKYLGTTVTNKNLIHASGRDSIAANPLKDERKNENPARIMCPGQNSNQGHPEYKYKALELAQPNRSSVIKRHLKVSHRTKMSIRNRIIMFLENKVRRVPKADNLTVIRADCLDSVGSLTSHNPIGLHGLLQG
jgi:hypothetical protein